MIRLLLRTGLKHIHDQERGSGLEHGIAVPLLDKHGNSTLVLPVVKSGDDGVIGGAPMLGVAELFSTPMLHLRFIVHGLLFEDLGGDGRLLITSSKVKTSRGRKGSPELLPPNDGGILAASFDTDQRVRPEEAEVIFPDRLSVIVKAIPGDAERGRDTPPNMRGLSMFRLYALTAPIPRTRGVTP